MSIDLTKIRSASFLPGLQCIGSSSATAQLSGLLPANGTAPGNLIGSFLLYFPTPDIISVMRINLPDANGDLANFWFPVMGTVQLHDTAAAWYLTLTVQNNASGRGVVFDFLNDANNDRTFTNFRIVAVAHLYTFPWQSVSI